MKTMRYSDLIEELRRIANILSPEECQKSLRALLNSKELTVIESRKSGKWVYFYEVKRGYSPSALGTDRDMGEGLGKISKETYIADKEKYDSMGLDELKKELLPVKKTKK